MRAWFVSSVAFASVGCKAREPSPPPSVIGTLLCEPHTPHLLGANGTLPDEIEDTKALQREVIARVTSEAFVHRVAIDEGFDEAATARAVSARPIKDSRLVEIGVAIPDRVLATRVCDAILDHYVIERRGGSGDPLLMPEDDVILLDHCRALPSELTSGAGSTRSGADRD
jgi:hypothetical protein